MHSEKSYSEEMHSEKIYVLGKQSEDMQCIVGDIKWKEHNEKISLPI